MAMAALGCLSADMALARASAGAGAAVSDGVAGLTQGGDEGSRGGRRGGGGGGGDSSGGGDRGDGGGRGGQGGRGGGQGASNGQVSTVCLFVRGRRSGQTQDYAPMRPLPLGVACSDGAGSTGVVIAPTRGGRDSGGRGDGGNSSVSTLCRFTSGRRDGQIVDYAPMNPIAVGSRCQDGAGSVGVVIARPPGPLIYVYENARGGGRDDGARDDGGRGQGDDGARGGGSRGGDGVNRGGRGGGQEEDDDASAGGGPDDQDNDAPRGGGGRGGNDSTGSTGGRGGGGSGAK